MRKYYNYKSTRGGAPQSGTVRTSENLLLQRSKENISKIWQNQAFQNCKLNKGLQQSEHSSSKKAESW